MLVLVCINSSISYFAFLVNIESSPLLVTSTSTGNLGFLALTFRLARGRKTYCICYRDQLKGQKPLHLSPAATGGTGKGFLRAKTTEPSGNPAPLARATDPIPKPGYARKKRGGDFKRKAFKAASWLA